MPRALGQRVAGDPFEDHRVETDPGHDEAGELGALCGYLLGVVLEDLLLEALDLLDFRQMLRARVSKKPPSSVSAAAWTLALSRSVPKSCHPR